ncbi:pentapeptide repeat-containing protein [Haloarchaeobius sp. DT45]|uniref:pentapeptide repeat-containing protein n=1 Tax=Haloarchaeobius sp. DT45 TaxID=3446116 RepID=UPI003F6C1EC7
MTQKERFYIQDRTPDNRCGVTTNYPEDSHEYPGNVTCWRQRWKEIGSDHCRWHTNVRSKDSEELTVARTNEAERLDGAMLRGTILADSVSFAGCSLFAADLTEAILQGADLSGVDLRDADLTETKLTGTDLTEADARGATLVGTNFVWAKLTDANFNEVTFKNVDCFDADLTRANFEGADLTSTKLYEAILIDANLRGANLTNANLEMSNLTEANVSMADFNGADLRSASFENTQLFSTEFTNADLHGASFTGAYAHSANFTEARLIKAEFTDADLTSAEFKAAMTGECDFTDTDLSHANFTDAVLIDSILKDAKARNATFTNAILENAILTRADLREASLENTSLYDIQFSDTRINNQTSFGLVCNYEETREGPYLNGSDTIQPMEAATWVYRRLESLHEGNAMADLTRHYHIRKEEAQRLLDRRQGNYGRWTVATLNRYLSLHGESIQHLLRAWVVTILGFAVLYPFGGGFNDNGEVYQIRLAAELPTANGVIAALEAVVRGVYFSTITFTTIGYANVSPHGFGSRILVGLESLIGAILIALFVYVLGRRVAR